MKHAMHNRILSLLLALMLLVGIIPVSVLTVDSTDGSDLTDGEYDASRPELIYDYESMYIARDGECVDQLDLVSYGKIELSAQGVDNASEYQWQVEHPEKDGVWINVYDGTVQTISVTLALVESVLRADGTARIRCRAYSDTYAYLTAPVTVCLVDEVSAPAHYAPVRNGSSGGSESSGEFVTVEIHYIKYEYVADENGNLSSNPQQTGEAYGAYVATLRSGSNLNITVPNPVLAGFSSTLVAQAGATETADDEIVISLSNVTQDVVYTVEFKPTQVPYTVHYYFQNIYDDQYVEDSSEFVSANGFTGTHPDIALTQKEFSGFTSLFYEPDIIAADGSTVFNVYYERNYYLMEFDCNNGYGTDTLYVRYGTHIAVADPVRSGWKFSGWDLISSDNPDAPVTSGDNTADVLEAAMPAYNSCYRAIWLSVRTTYKVAYWIMDDDGTRTYLGSRTEAANSGDQVHGEDDLRSQDEGGKTMCGYDEHTHSDDCYICGKSEHSHKLSCFSDDWTPNAPGSNGISAINDYENGNGPESGYIYVILNTASGQYWPTLYLEDSAGNGSYYAVNGYSGGTDESSFSAIVEGDTMGSNTGIYGTETLTVTKYKPVVTCGYEQHTHSGSCRICEEHAHADSCYQDTRNMEFLCADGVYDDSEYNIDDAVIVEGDGSTVVNVYYQYKEYTLKFYYAATTGGTADDNDSDASTYDSIKIVGGTTYYFGRSSVDTSDDETLLEYEYWNYSGQWGSVDELPTLNSVGESRNYTKGSVTYTYNSTDVTYHYISFKARYNDDISELWPCAVFNSVTRTDKDNTNGWSGTEAFVSAWNGEHHVMYSGNSNQTIKGIYERLDDNLLFDEKYTDETEVSYLCFWENGANIGWSVPELYRYNIWLEGKAPDSSIPTITRTDPSTGSSITYYLSNSYDTCDNSTVNEQTQVSLNGYEQICYSEDVDDYDDNNGLLYALISGSATKCFEYKELTGTDDSTLISSDSYFDKTLYKEGYQVNFYYKANRHSLRFFNHNRWLSEGQGAGNNQEGEGVRYGTALSVFGNYVNAEGFMDAHYPDGIEPGAYEFLGWYTTALCLPGTEVDWENGSMPDADLTLYAKWEPVIREVYFYATYDDMLDEELWLPYDQDGLAVPTSYPILVEHGQALGTAYNFIPVHPSDFVSPGIPKDAAVRDYYFVGWFYMDEENKKRFAPDTMEVKRDLHLFAEWRSTIDTQYTVEYKLLNEDSSVGEAGTVLADATVGHSTAGRTKTFTAKAGEQLYTQYQEAALFPDTNTHSILMNEDYTQNTYTFYYVVDEEVFYKVRYVDKSTGTEIAPVKDKDQNGNPLITTKAIVTEKFIYIDGYVPELFYITKVMASDGNSTEAIAENIITFYYLPNDTDTPEALYNVEYFKWNSALDKYESVQAEPNSGIVGDTITVDVPSDKFPGYSFAKGEVISHIADSESITEYPPNTSGMSAELTNYGLEFKLYYNPNSYPYLIRFVEFGDADNVLGYGMLGYNGQIYAASAVKNLTEVFGTETDYTAPSAIEIGNQHYNFLSQQSAQTQTLEIRVEDGITDSTNCTINVLTFYYEKKVIPIEYHAVCSLSTHEGGKVTQNQEPSPQQPIGCDALALPGYYFDGWYLDAECTKPVDSSWISNGTYITPADPAEGADGTAHYYALFKPIVLTISKMVDSVSTFAESFLFQIHGTGVDLIISLKDGESYKLILPSGDYTITELTDWSWKYSGTPTWNYGSQTGSGAAASITLSEYGGTVTFTNTYADPDWLGGEVNADNKFSN